MECSTKNCTYDRDNGKDNHHILRDAHHSYRIKDFHFSPFGIHIFYQEGSNEDDLECMVLQSVDYHNLNLMGASCYEAKCQKVLHLKSLFRTIRLKVINKPNVNQSRAVNTLESIFPFND